MAQSIGGGGGLAPSSSAALLGGTGGSGDGGTVSSHVQRGHLDLGQECGRHSRPSIGGGGGATLGTGNSVTGSLNTGAVGAVGAVTVTVNAPITVTGAGADGVIAQSVSNGGGLVMNGTTMTLLTGNSGQSGKVTVHANASITASGAGATASWPRAMAIPSSMWRRAWR